MSICPQNYESLKYEIKLMVSLWNLNGKINITVDNSKRKKAYNAQVIKSEGCTFLVFASGKVVATGVTDVSKPATVLQKLFPNNSVSFIRICNIVAQSYLPYMINSAHLLKAHTDLQYEPELFPAIYLKENGVTLQYFSTGSIIVTGAKTLPDIESILATLLSKTAHLNTSINQQ